MIILTTFFLVLAVQALGLHFPHGPHGPQGPPVDEWGPPTDKISFPSIIHPFGEPGAPRPASEDAPSEPVPDRTVTETKTITAVPWPSGTYGAGHGPWVPYGPHRPDFHAASKPFGGPSGCGPWGDSTWGPWSEWATRTDWRTHAPWTKWWGGSACPGTDWPGWTQGPWSTSAPWTTWEACEATATETSTFTTTMDGSEVVQTQFDVQVAAAPMTETPSDERVATRVLTAAAPGESARLGVGAVAVGVVGVAAAVL